MIHYYTNIAIKYILPPIEHEWKKSQYTVIGVQYTENGTATICIAQLHTYDIYMIL